MHYEVVAQNSMLLNSAEKLIGLKQRSRSASRKQLNSLFSKGYKTKQKWTNPKQTDFLFGHTPVGVLIEVVGSD